MYFAQVATDILIHRRRKVKNIGGGGGGGGGRQGLEYWGAKGGQFPSRHMTSY